MNQLSSLHYRPVVAALMFVTLSSTAQELETNVESQLDPYARDIVREACEFLTSKQGFRVKSSETREQVLDSGHKVQFSRDVDIVLRRPNKLAAEILSDNGQRKFYYDGARVSVHDLGENVYAAIETPDTVDGTLDLLMEKYGVSAPLSDILTSDPYANFTQNTTGGFYVGLSYINGEHFHHLAFENDAVDYQLWIQSEGDPLIRKVVITYRHLDGAPQFSASLDEWESSQQFADKMFEFKVPENSEKIEFLALTGKQSEGK